MVKVARGVTFLQRMRTPKTESQTVVYVSWSIGETCVVNYVAGEIEGIVRECLFQKVVSCHNWV